MRTVLALAFAAAVATQPLAAQAAPRIAHQPSGTRPYSAAVQVGDTYWFSGKVGATEETRAMTEGRSRPRPATSWSSSRRSSRSWDSTSGTS